MHTDGCFFWWTAQLYYIIIYIPYNYVHTNKIPHNKAIQSNAGLPVPPSPLTSDLLSPSPPLLSPLLSPPLSPHTSSLLPLPSSLLSPPLSPHTFPLLFPPPSLQTSLLPLPSHLTPFLFSSLPPPFRPLSFPSPLTSHLSSLLPLPSPPLLFPLLFSPLPPPPFYLPFPLTPSLLSSSLPSHLTPPLPFPHPLSPLLFPPLSPHTSSPLPSPPLSSPHLRYNCISSSNHFNIHSSVVVRWICFSVPFWHTWTVRIQCTDTDNASNTHNALNNPNCTYGRIVALMLTILLPRSMAIIFTVTLK